MTSLESLFQKELSSSLNKVLLVIEGNSYVLFNSYKIVPTKSNYRVIFPHGRKLFYQLKNAIAWVILKEYSLPMIKELERLDQILASVSYEIQVHENLYKKTNSRVYQNKLQFDYDRKRRIKEEIDQIIHLVVAIQDSSFSAHSPLRR